MSRLLSLIEAATAASAIDSESHVPPLWILVVAQVVTIAGDALGQRASRITFKHSTRRMLMCMTLVSSLQVFVLLGLAQLILPAKTMGAIYDGRDTVKCYQEVDIDGYFPEYCNTHPCKEMECPSQGPGSMWRSLYLHPLLWLEGFIGVAYYVGEVLLYHEPLGLVLIVMAALSSAFLLSPMGSLLGLEGVKQMAFLILLLGIIGSFLCVFEKQIVATSPSYTVATPWKRLWYQLTCNQERLKEQETQVYTSSGTENALSAEHRQDEIKQAKLERKRLVDGQPESSGAYTQAEHREIIEPELSVSDRRSRSQTDIDSTEHETGQHVANDVAGQSASLWALRVLVPFVLLAVTYALWFVTQRIFNKEYRTNAFGYTAIDQILIPIYIWGFLWLVDFIGPFKACFYGEEIDKTDTMLDSIKGMFHDATANHSEGWILVFFYRLLINGRNIVYFYLGVIFDLDVVYLELTLIRVVLSWVIALVICWLVPHFIGIKEAEKYTTFHPFNVFSKSLGTVLIVAALIIVNSSSRGPHG